MKKCIIVGLPDSGKSTYIGAFWAIECEGKSGHKLICSKYPSDSTYIDTLKDDWFKQEPVKRTSLAVPQNIKFDLKERDSETEIQLCIPDFKGETFQNILENNISQDVKEWLLSADSILFFVKNTKPDVLFEQIETIGQNTKQDIASAMKITDISEWIKNIMLLKYIRNNYGDKKIAICISAWDMVSSDDFNSVERMLEKNAPFLLNYVKFNFSNYRFYGVSAQGTEYKKDRTDKDKASLHKLTESYKRAYVVDTSKNYDITEPLYYLLKD